MQHAHHTAEDVERALHSSSGMYHFLLTPRATATRGYLALLAMLTRRTSSATAWLFVEDADTGAPWTDSS